MDMQTAYNLFIENRETYCSDATVRNYSYTIGYFIAYMKIRFEVESAEEIDVNKISLHDLNYYSIYLKNRIKNVGNPFIHSSDSKTLISSRTRKDYLKDMITFFNFLYEMEYIDNNPSARFRLPRAVGQPVEVLTKDEVEKLDNCYNPDTIIGSRNLSIIHLMLDEGMRSGEVQRLKWHDVNFTENYIVIRNSKYGKGRMLPLASIPRQCLIDYEKHKKKNPDDYLFSNFSDIPLSDNAVKCMFQRLKVKSGVQRVYPHLLRHTFATSFIMGGGSVEMLRIYMGHSSIDTTQRYLHLVSNMAFMKNIYPLDSCFFKKFY